MTELLILCYDSTKLPDGEGVVHGAFTSESALQQWMDANDHAYNPYYPGVVCPLDADPSDPSKWLHLCKAPILQ